MTRDLKGTITKENLTTVITEETQGTYPAPAIVQSTRPQAWGGADVPTLIDMHRVMRPHKSEAEKGFIIDFIDPATDRKFHYDAAGNACLQIPGKGEDIMWACHTDTVHRFGGKQDITFKDGVLRLRPDQRVEDMEFDTFKLTGRGWGQGPNCLGADDGAGCWLARELIRAEVPGYYVFHRGEERGGIGSMWKAKHHEGKMKGYRACISLDRYGYDSVITHQGFRSCSDAFAQSLADAIDMGMKPDPTGLFTDSANYTDAIGECTNLSVGYGNHHTSKEWLDVDFLVSLRHALIEMDQSLLVFERPAGQESKYYWGGGYASGGWGWYDDNDISYNSRTVLETESAKDYLGTKVITPDSGKDYEQQQADEIYEDIEHMAMSELIDRYPGRVARYLQDVGVTFDELDVINDAHHWERFDR